MPHHDEFRVCAEYACGSSARLRLTDGFVTAQFDNVRQLVPRVEFFFRDGRLHMTHSLPTEPMNVGDLESRMHSGSDTGATLRSKATRFGLLWRLPMDGLLRSAPGEPHFKFRAAPDGEAFQFTLSLG